MLVRHLAGMSRVALQNSAGDPELDDAGAASASLVRMASFGPLLARTEPLVPLESGTGDTVGDSPSEGMLLALGATFTAAIDTYRDIDYFLVELVAGQSYVFTLTGTGATPLFDPFITVGDLSGGHRAIDDDGGPGLNSVLRYTAQVTGQHWVSVEAFDNRDPSQIGEYTLTFDTGPAQNPLDTIDLGYTVPTTNIEVYFASATESHNGVVASRAWTQAEIDAAMAALGAYSAVTNLTFTQVTSAASADFVLSIAALPSGVGGQFSTTGGVGYGAFSSASYMWSAEAMRPGGQTFAVMVHEFGHGLGLAHPHDNGGIDPDNSSEIMQGVLSDFYSYGEFGLNQGVYTVMSYNRGNGQATLTSGNEATPGTLDIGLLQQRYGVNTTTNAGDTTYVIPDSTTSRAFQAIWDTGGTDWIISNGSLFTTIDLRPATLLNETGGGGGLSTYRNGGGFAIAYGVVIENARGGDAVEYIWGNAVSNTLDGGGGDDTIWGGAGVDTLIGGEGWDTISFAEDIAGVTVNLAMQTATDGWGNAETLTGFEYVRGSAYADVLTAPDFTDADPYYGDITLDGGGGDDTIYDGAGNDHLYGGSGDDLVHARYGTNRVYGDQGNDHILGGAGSVEVRGGEGDDLVVAGSGDVAFYGELGNDRLEAGSGLNQLIGYEGDDLLLAGDGRNELSGGEGSDTIDYSRAASGVWVAFTTDPYSMATGQGTGNDGLFDVENAIGSAFADRLTGVDGVANRLEGGAGDDHLDGRGGNDILIGGTGTDTAIYAHAAAAVTVRLWNGTAVGGAGNDTLAGIENVTGSAHGDSLLGADGVANRLDGGRGSDYLAGLSGDDQLIGGDGDDTLEGGLGNDVLNGGAGADAASYASATSAVTVRLWNNTVAGSVGSDAFISIENAIGSAHGDSLVGSDGASNRLDGGAGNDFINGLSGDDHLLGGTGNDTLVGSDGADTLDGGVGDDRLDGGAGNDTVTYAASIGAVTVRLWTQAATGAAGNDTLTSVENATGSAFGDSLIGADGAANRLDGGAGADYLNGLSGNDHLVGGEGNDTLVGGEGDDILDGGPGLDTLDGGAGDDMISFESASAPVIVRFWAGTFSIGGQLDPDTLISIEHARGSGHSDSLIGADGVANRLEGAGGNDYLNGLGGDDILMGGDGADTLEGVAGNDRLDGGAGNDTATYAAASGAVTVRLWSGAATGAAGNDALASIETVIGSAYSDTLIGADASADTLRGEAGNDYLNGLSGNDTLVGGAGNDTLDGGDGDDWLDPGVGQNRVDGGAGDDTLVFSGATAGVSFSLETGALSVGGQVSMIQSASIENVVGSAFADTLTGTVSGDSIGGAAGDDTLSGLGGNDTLSGGDGNDNISGGEGDDTLSGGDGNDQLLGGAGNDILQWTRDGIDHFDGGDGVDTLSLAGSDIGVAVNLRDSQIQIWNEAGIDTVVSVEILIGSAYEDYLLGSDFNNTIDGGVEDDVLMGYDGDDLLIGGAGAGWDVFYGGAGNDTLIGGDGNDTFYLDSPFGPENIDTIVDFDPGSGEQIRLTPGLFEGAWWNTWLKPEAFVIGPAATTAAHRIIYNSSTGDLLFDADGSGSGEAVLFGIVSAGLDIRPENFWFL